GFVAKRFGSLKVFFIFSLLFVIFSIVCGISNSITQMFSGRFLQGICSGFVITTSQQLFVNVLGTERKNFALAIWGSAISFGPLTGPIVGAWLTDAFGWPWIFFINVPIVLICLMFFDYKSLFDSAEEKPSFNFFALLCAGTFFASLQYQIDFGEQLMWYQSPLMKAAFVISIISVVLFPFLNKHKGAYLLDFSLFRNRQYAMGTTIITVGNGLIMSSLLYFPVWLQRSYGMPIFEAGLVVASSSLLSVFLAPIVGKKLQPKYFEWAIVFSLLVLATSFSLMSLFRLESSMLAMMLPRILFGLGTTLFYIPLTAFSLSTLPHEKMVSANSLSLLLRVVFANIFIGASFVLLSKYQYFAYDNYVSAIDRFFINRFSDKDFPHLDWVMRKSSTEVLSNIFLFSALICACMAIPIMLLKTTSLLVAKKEKLKAQNSFAS
ncbi:MAG: MFS transporter, partial [Cellvibrio sp.]